MALTLYQVTMTFNINFAGWDIFALSSLVCCAVCTSQPLLFALPHQLEQLKNIAYSLFNSRIKLSNWNQFQRISRASSGDTIFTFYSTIAWVSQITVFSPIVHKIRPFPLLGRWHSTSWKGQQKIIWMSEMWIYSRPKMTLRNSDIHVASRERSDVGSSLCPSSRRWLWYDLWIQNRFDG